MADLMTLEEMLNPFQATQNRLKRALAQAQGQPQAPQGFPAGLADQIPGNAPQMPQQAPQMGAPAAPAGAGGPQPPQQAPTPQQPPAAPQQPRGRVVSKSLASTSGTSAAPEAPFTDADKKAPEVPTQGKPDHWSEFDRRSADYERLINEPSDYSGYERISKQKGDVAGNNLMLSLLMQQTSGFEDTGKHMLRQALAAQGPQEFDEGMVDVSGRFVEKPGASRLRKARAAEFMLNAEEKRALRNMTAEEKAATLAAAENRWQAEQKAQERRHRESLGATYAGQNKLQFQKGDNGEMFAFDPRTGTATQINAGGMQTGAPNAAGLALRPLPKGASTEDKNTWSETGSAITQTQDLQRRLATLTTQQQGEVGGIGAAIDTGLKGLTQGSVRNPLYNPSPKVREMQTAVQRDAAMLINKLYGAALSKIESGRAGQFTVMPGDDFSTVQRKLQEAIVYAQNERSRIARTYNLPQDGPGGGGAPGQKGAADYLKQAGG